MKIFVACTVLVMSALAEPPVSNQYLPPNQGGGQNGYRTTSPDSFAPPAQTYGPPNQGAPQKQTDAVFGARPSQSYGPPTQSRPQQQRRPSQQYGAPSQQQSNGFGSRGQAPSQQYGAPAPSQQYSAPQAPSQKYGAPSAPSAPSQQYSAPSAPSQQYGAPEQSREYLPPNGNRKAGYAGDEDGNGEPANYNFEYMVKDDQSGNDFGHKESRQGDRAEGTYYVLLPDGRKQTVQYEADQDGYRPKISYEDTGAGAGGFGGYDANSQAQGYQQNGGQGYQQNGY